MCTNLKPAGRPARQSLPHAHLQAEACKLNSHRPHTQSTGEASNEALGTCACGCLQVQQARDEVNFDFPVDDTGGEREDALVGMSFHVPRDTSQYAGDDDTASNKVRSLHCCSRVFSLAKVCTFSIIWAAGRRLLDHTMRVAWHVS